MFQEIRKNITINNQDLTISNGKIARQANGSVTVRMGDTIVLVTTCVVDSKSDTNFLPLTVHYREMYSSAGKIPGGFVKREGKPSEHEILTSRLIDRSVRPLFPDSFRNEVQIIVTVLSYDPEYSPDILGIIGASASLSLSQVPISTPISACRVGIIENEFVLNPSNLLMKDSNLDIVICGTEESIYVIECEASQIPEDKLLDAIKFAQSQFKDVISAIKELETEKGITKLEISQKDDDLFRTILNEHQDKIKQCLLIKEKQERVKSLAHLWSELTPAYENHEAVTVVASIKSVESYILRSMALNEGIRIDGRKNDEIRDIDCETGLIPRAHGSALFTRGETQALVYTTLGGATDEQMIDGLEKVSKEHFMLHYTFLPYSVGEISQLKGVSKREIGHGKLAWRAVKAVLPSKSNFPYTIRISSEITESNGSSSMATVCGASLSMMDAGIPITHPVAGIAMGLIKEKDKVVILSDILGDEDYLGDMDFKVAGTKEGITALQMDIKVNGIDINIIKQALEQALKGKIYILEKMNKEISQNRNTTSKYAPRAHSIGIPKEKIRELIGAGGKVVKEICESTGVKIDISEDGTVQITTNNDEALELAIKKIKLITEGPEIGSIIEGKVVKLMDFGAFVSINYIKNDGLVHISEISKERVNKVSEHLKEGDVVTVKVLGFDDKGKMKLSIKQAIEE